MNGIGTIPVCQYVITTVVGAQIVYFAHDWLQRWNTPFARQLVRVRPLGVGQYVGVFGLHAGAQTPLVIFLNPIQHRLARRELELAGKQRRRVAHLQIEMRERANDTTDTDEKHTGVVDVDEMSVKRRNSVILTLRAARVVQKWEVVVIPCAENDAVHIVFVLSVSEHDAGLRKTFDSESLVHVGGEHGRQWAIAMA